MKYLLLFRVPFKWLEVAANRRKVYLVARVVLPLLVAAGWLSTGQQNDVLTVLQFLASFAVPQLAARNTR